MRICKYKDCNVDISDKRQDALYCCKRHKELSRDRSEYQKLYRISNPDKINSYEKKEERVKYKIEYREKNRESIREYDNSKWLERKVKYKERIDKYRKSIDKNKRNEYNRGYMPSYIKNRKEVDPIFKVSLLIGDLIRKSIRKQGFSKKSRTHEILGCSFDEFKKHLESKFEDWMNWSNHGIYNGELKHGWDIDHIRPTSSALTEDDVIKLNHYTNFQPLDGYINRYIKRNKI